MAKKSKVVPVDIRFDNCGSIVVLRPVSAAGRGWVEDNVSIDGWQNYGQVAVEPRYANDIIEGARDAGLEVELS